MSEPFNPPQWARDARLEAVAGTGSAAPAVYAPISPVPPVYDIAGHGAQYGRPRRYDAPIQLIVFHTTESGVWLNANLIYDMRRAEMVGQTAMIGRYWDDAGRAVIAYTTPEDCRPWTQGRWNDGALSVEVCGRAAMTRAEWDAVPGLFDAVVRLIVDWCRRYRIPPIWLTPGQIAGGASPRGADPWKPLGDHPGICDHAAANEAAKILGHSDGYHHTDVGAGLRTLLADAIAAAADLLNPPPSPPTLEEQTMITINNAESYLWSDADPADGTTPGSYEPGTVKWALMPDGTRRHIVAGAEYAARRAAAVPEVALTNAQLVQLTYWRPPDSYRLRTVTTIV